jgi:translation elongation factor EF-Tu-like GTPase
LKTYFQLHRGTVATGRRTWCFKTGEIIGIKDNGNNNCNWIRNVQKTLDETVAGDNVEYYYVVFQRKYPSWDGSCRTQNN